MSCALREGGGEGAGLEIFADCDQRGETRRACTGPGCPKGSGRELICRPPAPRDTPTMRHGVHMWCGGTVCRARLPTVVIVHASHERVRLFFLVPDHVLRFIERLKQDI